MTIQKIQDFFQKKQVRLVLLAIGSLFIISLFLILSIKPSEKKAAPPSQINLQKPVQTTIPSTDVSGLLYRSNGDGSCTVMGMGTCIEQELTIPRKSPDGEIVIAIGERAFSECESLLSITLPACIQKIGNAAFMGCSSLVNIDVDRDNENFCSISGVLYSKNKSILLCYPSNRNGNKYLLNSNIEQVASYAFYGNRNLQHILYEKTVDSFRDIKINEGNSMLSTVTITCNYTVSAKG